MAKQKILIVDDDETILEILKQTLSENGYDHVSAEDGEAALTQLQSNDNIDAVILDILMPKMDGRETLKEIKNDDKAKHLPILMLTGENSLADVSECLTLGANEYMVKPFESDIVISRLQKILPPRSDIQS